MIGAKRESRQRSRAMSLYENMNKRKREGTSRSKANSTVDSKTYSMMKRRKGGFAEKKKDG